ncbi:MAG: sensor histidine kinase [Solirubrobacteraceae bacterium]
MVTHAQPSFGAYAAHELRGEIAVQLTLAEAVLADPDADTAALREMGEQVVASCERQQQLLEALLTLARGDHRQMRREPVDLAAVVAGVLRAHDPCTLTLTTVLQRALTVGDPPLLERLVANLISNAIRHNRPGGLVDIATCQAAGRATLTIANTGRLIRAGEVARLFQPFQRLGDRADASGLGLGLPIVQAIADAHGAIVTARVRPAGGLRVHVSLPSANAFVTPGLAAECKAVRGRRTSQR